MQQLCFYHSGIDMFTLRINYLSNYNYIAIECKINLPTIIDSKTIATFVSIFFVWIRFMRFMYRYMLYLKY